LLHDTFEQYYSIYILKTIIQESSRLADEDSRAIISILKNNKMYRIQLGLHENELIQHLINRYDWIELETICNTSPTHMKCMLKNTNTPLHEICNIGSAPFHMIQKVMECWNEAAITRNSHGETPLHIKCKSSQYSCDPVTMLIEGNQKALRMLSNTGKTPLALACLSGACLPVIQVLVLSYPEALTIRDVHGHTPLDLLWSSFAKTIPGASAISKFFKSNPDEEKYGMSCLLERFYKKMCFCLSESYSLSHSQEHIEGNNNRTFLVCHAIICEDLKNCPHMLLKLFLLHDTSLGYQVDNDGNTPLHLQIESKWNYECISVLIEKSKGNPSSIRNNQGMLPLHIALRKMKDHKEEYHHVDDVIGKLVNAFPDALAVKDPNTMLYPFMAAAVANKLQLSYDLLLSQPNIVMDVLVV
jgi:ankyrin repeat protein